MEEDRQVCAPSRTRGLKASAEEKARASRHRVVDAIDHMIKEQQAVSFHSVATKAGVSRAYLYNHSDLRERIEALRRVQGGGSLRLVSGTIKEAARTDKCKDFILAAKEKRIRELEGENKKLNEQVKKLRGQLFGQL